ncbi:MAG: hypothetical protein HY912_14580, partial [Desulfomonile tiedjei]|nr:hypothetical protein [Desulfomonile tiedjei]
MNTGSFTCPEPPQDSEASDPILSCARSNNVEKHGIENVGFLDLTEVLEIIRPIRVQGPTSGPISGISIDTRKPMGEDFVFWAIKGEHFNGNDFVEDAIAAGARAAVVSRDDIFREGMRSGVTLVQVPDTLTALQDLAAAYRNRFRF